MCMFFCECMCLLVCVFVFVCMFYVCVCLRLLVCECMCVCASACVRMCACARNSSRYRGCIEWSASLVKKICAALTATDETGREGSVESAENGVTRYVRAQLLGVQSQPSGPWKNLSRRTGSQHDEEMEAWQRRKLMGTRDIGGVFWIRFRS